MNPALFRKTLRDAAPLLLLLTAAIVLFEALFVRAAGELSGELGRVWIRQPFVQRFLRVIAGAEVGLDPSPTAILSIAFAHPVLHALIWTFIVTTATRVLAGEFDRGTADLLLTLPISRPAFYITVGLGTLLPGVALCGAPLAGAWIGTRIHPLWEPVDFSKLAMLCVNLMALYAAISGLALLASALASRRGRAVAGLLTLLIASLAIAFLRQFWSALDAVAGLGLLNYYRPLPIVRAGEWPVGDLLTLAGTGAAAWLAGLIAFLRRDIPAV